MKFEQYGFSDSIQRNLEGLGFRRPTDIQFKAIPPILKGEDVLAIAQTGTGKTAAYAIPLIENIHRSKANKRATGVICLVMVPTRELALQVGRVFEQIAAKTKVSVMSLHGGVEQDPQIQGLNRGTDILISTPGRMFDLVNQQALSLQDVECLVLDEADRMFELGFLDDIRYVKKLMRQQHQTIFVSATINQRIKKLAYAQVKGNAIRIELSPKDPISKNVTHSILKVEADHKRFFLEEIAREHPDTRMMVFVRTRVRAERVQKAMNRVDITTQILHGEIEQSERIKVLDAFRNHEFPILITTDVGARGIDVAGVDLVINYDLPVQAENYVHRVGRTGRGNQKGTAISFFSKEELEQLEEIQTYLGQPLEEISMGKKAYKHLIQTAEAAELSETNPFEDLENLVQESRLSTDRRSKSKKKKRK